MPRASLRTRLEALESLPAPARRPTAENAKFARLRASLGAALGLRDTPTLKGDCPGLAFLKRVTDGNPETRAVLDADDERALAEERVRILGDLIARQWATERDLAAVRALPAEFLRSHSSVLHYALFVAVRAE